MTTQLIQVQETPKRKTRDISADPIFETMGPASDETKLQLKGWRPPNFAYVLLETREVDLRRPRGQRLTHGLCIMNVENRPEQIEKLYFYKRKGYRVLHYGNFPKLMTATGKRLTLLKAHMGPNGINPWDSLENVVLQELRSDKDHFLIREELRGTQAKLEQARKELEEARNGGAEKNYHTSRASKPLSS